MKGSLHYMFTVREELVFTATSSDLHSQMGMNVLSQERIIIVLEQFSRMGSIIFCTKEGLWLDHAYTRDSDWVVLNIWAQVNPVRIDV